MVLYTYTIINPWTMVVKSFNTLIAGVTVPRSWSPDCVTIWAELDWVHNLHQFQEINIVGLLDDTWTREHSTQPKYHSEAPKRKICVYDPVVLPNWK